MQIGLGVGIGPDPPNFTQGSIENTGVPTNVAIQGTGFFVIGDGVDRTYTRAGNFGFNANGMLVTSDGRPVQGYTAVDPLTGADRHVRCSPTDIVAPPGVLRAPVATTHDFDASPTSTPAPPSGATLRDAGRRSTIRWASRTSRP